MVAKTPDFTGVSGRFGMLGNYSFVEMAGVEPASRTLLNKALTLISGVWCFVNHCYTCKDRFTIPV